MHAKTVLNKGVGTVQKQRGQMLPPPPLPGCYAYGLRHNVTYEQIINELPITDAAVVTDFSPAADLTATLL